MLSIPLVFISSTPMINGFDVFMVCLVSCMFHSLFHRHVSWYFTVWSNSSPMFSVPYTLPSTFSNLFTKLLI
jgi:hypothetical protein